MACYDTTPPDNHRCGRRQGFKMIAKAIGLVDAGFLRQTIATALQVEVGTYDVNALAVRAWMSSSAGRIDRDLLRAYWYDGAWPPDAPQAATQRSEFEKIDSLPGVRVRTGRLVKRPNKWQSALKRALCECKMDINELSRHFDFKDSVEQKGVDTLMVLDMTKMAQDRVYESLILISGDSDLVEAVRVVQDMGREVIVAAPKGVGLSPELRRAADEVVSIEAVELKKFITPFDFDL